MTSRRCNPELLLHAPVAFIMANHCRFFAEQASRRWAADELIDPLDEPFHVRCVRVTAIMLAPGELPVEQSLIYRRHLRDAIVLVHPDSSCAQQRKHAAGVRGRHEAALMVEPFG